MLVRFTARWMFTGGAVALLAAASAPRAAAQPAPTRPTRVQTAPQPHKPPRLVRAPSGPIPTAGAPLPKILLTGYWPPTNEMLRRFSQSPTQNPTGWIGANWEGRGYDVVSYFPEFSPPNCSSCGKGSGDLEVDYQDTSTDFWNIANDVRPIAVITFSRGAINMSWEVESNQYNKTNWISDYVSPFKPTPTPPDDSVPPGTLRPSLLPLQSIVDAINNSGLGLNSFICVTGDGGGFLSEFMAYHGVWYQSKHRSPTDPDWCVTAGHVHVGGQIPWHTATAAAQETLRVVIQHVDAERAAVTCQSDLGFQGPGAASIAMCGDPLTPSGETDFAILDAPPSSPVTLFASTVSQPTPVLAGTLITVPPILTVVLPTNAEGDLLLEDVSLGGGPATLFMQGAYGDGALPLGVGFTNALKIDLLP